MTGRGLRGRRQARVMLLIALAVVGFEGFLFVAQPNYIGPMYEPSVVSWLIPAIGVAAQILGLGWMIRIYRTDPEGGRSWWRFTGSPS